MFYGVKLIGINSITGHKLLISIAFIAALALLRVIIEKIARWYLHGHPNDRLRFWLWQAISICSALILLFGLLSIWFDNPKNLTTAVGLISAGLAFALQKVVTSIAGYLVILRGRNFTVGDRIAMAGVRGDVIALGFIQTTIMEMGQSPGEQSDEPSVWVKSRQYTGRVVTVTNDKIFDQPVYNYSREIPFTWEEMIIPISFKDDRKRAEQILLSVAERHTASIVAEAQKLLKDMEQDYELRGADTAAKVYYRITDNWIELTLRFISLNHRVRQIKDVMSREILAAFEEAGIGIASGTYEIVGLPPVRVQMLNESNQQNNEGKLPIQGERRKAS